MKKYKFNKSYFFIFLFIIIIVTLFFYVKTNKEGYTSDNITTASGKLNEILTDNLEQLKTVINDINTQKYQLSMSEVINALNNEYSSDNKLNLPENAVTDNYLKKQIKDINYLQSNMTNINKRIDSLFESIKVDMVDLSTERIETYDLLEALNKISLDIKKASNSLSQIPP
jgi:hypothetical protein